MIIQLLLARERRAREPGLRAFDGIRRREKTSPAAAEPVLVGSLVGGLQLGRLEEDLLQKRLAMHHHRQADAEALRWPEARGPT